MGYFLFIDNFKNNLKQLWVELLNVCLELFFFFSGRGNDFEQVFNNFVYNCFRLFLRLLINKEYFVYLFFVLKVIGLVLMICLVFELKMLYKVNKGN